MNQRLEDLRRYRPRPAISPNLTNDEVQRLVDRLMPEFRFHHEENYFPESITSLLTDRGIEHSDGLKVPAIVDGSDRGTTPRSKAVQFDKYDGTELGGDLTKLADKDVDDRWDVNMGFGLKSKVKDEYASSEANKPRVPLTPPVVVYAEFRDPLATIAADRERHEVQSPNTLLRKDGDGAPVVLDAARGPSTIPTMSGSFTNDASKHLKKAIDQPRAVRKADVAPGLGEEEWWVLQNAVFLEFYLHYVFNDLDSHQNFITGEFTRIFDHEGDVEASVVYVFERSDIKAIEKTTDEDKRRDLLDRLQPRFVIQMGPEFGQGSDSCQPVVLGPLEARDRRAWIAAGSHASAPNPTTTRPSPLASSAAEAASGLASDNPGLATAVAIAAGPLGVAATAAAAVSIGALLALLGEFLDAKDKRSDHGHQPGAQSGGQQSSEIGEGPQPSAPGRQRDIVARVVPLGEADSIYDEKMGDETLAVRSFPGFWGWDGGVRWRPKTGRVVSVLADWLRNNNTYMR